MQTRETGFLALGEAISISTSGHDDEMTGQHGKTVDSEDAIPTGEPLPQVFIGDL
ncbi:MAG TPA: hypothetical protein VGN53_12250 [Klebsiella sp.]|jgi:hypothetical protein